MKAVAQECQETQTEATEEMPMFTVPLKDVIDEGAACWLEAGCWGLPNPTITWYKEGIPVASKSDDQQPLFSMLACPPATPHP